MITLEQAKGLYIGQTLFTAVHNNADGTPQRWRVNGQIKLWKTRPTEFSVPIKWGLYGYDYLTHNNAHYMYLTEEEAMKNEQGL